MLCNGQTFTASRPQGRHPPSPPVIYKSRGYSARVEAMIRQAGQPSQHLETTAGGCYNPSLSGMRHQGSCAGGVRPPPYSAGRDSTDVSE